MLVGKLNIRNPPPLPFKHAVEAPVRDFAVGGLLTLSPLPPYAVSFVFFADRRRRQGRRSPSPLKTPKIKKIKMGRPVSFPPPPPLFSCNENQPGPRATPTVTDLPASFLGAVFSVSRARESQDKARLHLPSGPLSIFFAIFT